jgi:uncharacterized protein (DUF58 family)
MVHFSDDLLRAVAELQLKAKRNVTALLAGNYRSAFRGSGMQFKEFRHYEPGDDIRHMSWPVTARTGRATVKTFEEERELNVMLMVDVSGSSLFGMTPKRKIDMYAELVALIGLAAIRSGDNVGLLLYNEAPVLYLPPKRTRDQVLTAISHVLSQPLRGTRSQFAPALNHLQSVLKQRALIIALSDFWVPPFDRELTQLARRHELVLLHCYDDAERGAGLEGVYEICDPETGELLLLDAGSKKVKRSLAEHHTRLTNDLEDLCRRSRADYLTLSVEDDYFQRLVHFFHRRGPSRM